MIPPEVVNRIVARTRHERFRQLLDPEHPDYDPRYERHAIRLAVSKRPRRRKQRVDGSPRLDTAMMIRNARACPHRKPIPSEDREGCGCAHRCEAEPTQSTRSDRGVTIVECWNCPIAPRHSRTP